MLKLEGALGDKYNWLIAKLQKDLKIQTRKEVQSLMFDAFCDLVDYDYLVFFISHKNATTDGNEAKEDNNHEKGN